jgi:DNA-binding beta-propeller fold protein YncE
MKAQVRFGILIFLVTGLSVDADLFVIRDGPPSRAIVRVREDTAQVIGTLGVSTEEFCALTAGPDGNIYATVNTLGYGDIVKLSKSGRLLAQWSGGGLRTPGTIRFGRDGNLYVVGSTWPEAPERGLLLRFDATTGGFMDQFGEVQTNRIGDFAFGRDGQIYAEVSQGISLYDAQTGAFKDVFVAPGDGGLSQPGPFMFGRDGHLYICSYGSNSVLKFDGATGKFLRTLVPSGRGGLRGPTGLAFDRDGNLYVSSYQNSRILKYNGRTGQFLGVLLTAHPQVYLPRRMIYVRAG